MFLPQLTYPPLIYRYIGLEDVFTINYKGAVKKSPRLNLLLIGIPYEVATASFSG